MPPSPATSIASPSAPVSSSSRDPRITYHSFTVGIGITLSIALISVVGRTYARFSRSRRVSADDVFFYIAATFLTAGTGLLYKDVTKHWFLVHHVAVNLKTPPPGFVQRLVYTARVGDVLTALWAGTIFSIKLSFLFFFRSLIWPKKRLMIWWWFVLVLCILSGIEVMFSNFIGCAYFDERIIAKCINKAADARQTAAFKVDVALDIFTDACIISIPTMLLRKVHMPLRRKIALGGILSLSLFMIVTAIIRLVPPVDPAWRAFWVQVESSIAVIMASVSAFRALYVAHQASKHNEKLFRRNQMPSFVKSRRSKPNPSQAWLSQSVPTSVCPEKDHTDVCWRSTPTLNTEGSLTDYNGRSSFSREEATGAEFQRSVECIEMPLPPAQVHLTKDVYISTSTSASDSSPSYTISSKTHDNNSSIESMV